MDWFEHVDPRLRDGLRAELLRRAHAPGEGLPRGVTVVLAGHRAAGKSTLLRPVATLLQRPPVDLDAHLEATHGRSLRSWVADDVTSFRRAEREAFLALPRGVVVAVGGGFLSHHPEALLGCVTVLVPLSFETYRERLLADTSRPRLRPELPLEAELEMVWHEREALHRRVKTLSLVDVALAARRPARARRVVTLPPFTHPVEFAWKARHAGAEVLEVRTDLTPLEVDLTPVARALPVLVAERGPLAPASWRSQASLLDAADGDVRSFHAEAPLSADDAVARWASVPGGAHLKHVEPLGDLRQAHRLVETQRRLIERFGADRVTVLATGPLALPFRALLALDNALDYLALEPTWAAAPGQRLVADAVRASQRARVDSRTQRLGILGHPLAHSRSPRLHAQPFDRLDVPPDTDVATLLEVLKAHYRGFAVTNPFKKAVARAVGAPRPAVNTLVRDLEGWASFNTDREGAAAALAVLLERTGARRVTVLGDGGATDALKDAASQLGLELLVMPRETAGPVTTKAVVWTWPAPVEVPASLRLDGALVAVIAYGAPARAIAASIRARGGTPLKLGPRWFVAQARRQRSLWESST
ncbi:MAG: shikimate kinase [Myxococcaceae bacterium]|nr:shikimate kinase [Myxococcaceae bacterium]